MCAFFPMSDLNRTPDVKQLGTKLCHQGSENLKCPGPFIFMNLNRVVKIEEYNDSLLQFFLVTDDGNKES